MRLMHNLVELLAFYRSRVKHVRATAFRQQRIALARNLRLWHSAAQAFIVLRFIFPACRVRCRSSVVEHFIGNEEVGGSIPPGSTSF